MATVVLSAVGAAVGGSIGGTVFGGLSTAVLGRAVGATIGRVIDQRIMGQGSEHVETGKVDRFYLSNSGEGEAIAQVYGQTRVGGQVIWATNFLETTTTTTSGGGGKGAPSQPKTTTTEYSYSLSLAMALCEGVITRVGRVWADGEEMATNTLNMRVYSGSDDQLPDPLIEAVEGAGQVPAYRGTAYVVLENLELSQFGNRVPQFSFEVFRPEQPDADDTNDMTRAIEAVAVMPGTGEYALATSAVNYTSGPGSAWSANINTPARKADFNVSLDALAQELPNVGAGSLIVSWFGDDLRCADCQIRPKVEQKTADGAKMPWRVAGLTRTTAEEIAQVDDKPIYGGTPTDQSVIEAIRGLQAAGKAVMFYPFILMEQLQGNGLPDPYGAAEQPHLPWRGRITTSLAPGQPGSPDGSADAEAEAAAFFGTARAHHFTVGEGTVSYSGPDEWSFSRFILHYAALCAAAGGVESFCIGSELRGLTQIRGDGNAFPFVAHLQVLAAEARSLLGTSTMIGYAADWSEYFGYQPNDANGDRYFHLDPLWANPEIDFVGIDNYMPLSDWRDGEGHADAEAGSIYDLGYLQSNIEGGEGYDWYYASDADAEDQIRTPISDGAHGEPWVFRYKDLRNWWLNPHHERIGGVRQAQATDWVPQSKPIWFTEYGCATVDKATNQPNKFVDPKSSESSLPAFSNGARDDLIQMQYIRAMTGYYGQVQNNPTSAIYGGPMVDMSRAFVWAWDARPYPYFPSNQDLWSDGENYAKGHWLNGRTSARTLASVVTEICKRAGLTAIDTTQLHGYVRGYTVSNVGSARSALQPLMLAYGFDAVERDAKVHFVMRNGQQAIELDPDWLARVEDLDGVLEHERDADVEMSGRVRLQFTQADGSFEAVSEETSLPNETPHDVATSEIPLSLNRAEGRQILERWLSEARVARDKVKFALPPSRLEIGAGDVIALPVEGDAPARRFRIDKVQQGTEQVLDAVRIEPNIYVPASIPEDMPTLAQFTAPTPVTPLYLDLPLMRGDEVPHAPFIGAPATGWPGSAAVYASATDSNYALNMILPARATVGVTQSALPKAAPAIWDGAGDLVVKMVGGTLESASDEAVMAGANLAAIGDGSPGGWELIQFADAELIAPDTYALRRRLRGQQGSEAQIPDSWPVGTWFVLLNGALQQMDLGANMRQVTQYFRIGPAQLPIDDPLFEPAVHAFDGNGLRPYAPAHIRSVQSGGGDLSLSWTRRTRIDGDNWEGEVPIGEEQEAYRVNISKDGTVLRTVDVTQPGWNYPEALQTADGATGAIEVSVAQISERYGPGSVQRAVLQV